MLNRYIGKNVEITVAFASSISETGPVPVAYYGVLQEVEDDYCVLSLSFKRPLYDSFSVVGTRDFGGNCVGNICIRKDFIISCLELPAQ